MPVTIDATNQPVDQLLTVVARRAGVQVSRSGSLYFVGSLRKEDKAVLVRRVRRLTPDELGKAVQPFLSDNGDLATYGDGLLIVGDRVDVLERVNDLVNQIEATDSGVWCVQLHLVSLTDTQARELSLTTEGTLDLATTFAAASAGHIDTSGLLSGSLSAVLEFARLNATSSIVAEPLYYLRDGEKARLFRGDQVPIERITFANDANNVGRELKDYEYRDTGLDITVQLRELAIDSATLTIDAALSTVSGQAVNGAPIFAREEYNTAAPVRSGGVYLLGAIERNDSTREKTMGWTMGGKKTNERRVLQIWCRAVRVQGDGLTGSSSLLPGCN